MDSRNYLYFGYYNACLFILINQIVTDKKTRTHAPAGNLFISTPRRSLIITKHPAIQKAVT